MCLKLDSWQTLSPWQFGNSCRLCWDIEPVETSPLYSGSSPSLHAAAECGRNVCSLSDLDGLNHEPSSDSMVLHLGLIQQQDIQPDSSSNALIKCSVSASSCLWALLYFRATLYDFNERRDFSPCFGPPLSFPLMPLLGKHPHPFDISTDNVLIHQEQRTAPSLRRIAGSGKGLCWT